MNRDLQIALLGVAAVGVAFYLGYLTGRMDVVVEESIATRVTVDDVLASKAAYGQEENTADTTGNTDVDG